MDTKSYLAQMWNIDRRIMDKLAEADRWMDIAYSRSIGKSKQIKHDVIQESHESQDKIADAVAMSLDYRQEAMNMSAEMVKTKYLIQNQISQIADDTHYNILHAYYVDEKNLSQIATEEHYSIKSARRHYEAAVRRFESEFGSTYL